MTGNDLSDPRRQDDAKKKERLARERIDAAIEKVMRDKDLQYLVFQFLQQCRIYESSFTGNSETFFREGMRAAGHWWISRLEAQSKGNYPKMLLNLND